MISEARIPNETTAPDMKPLFKLVSVIAKNTGPKEMVNGKAVINPIKKYLINLKT